MRVVMKNLLSNMRIYLAGMALLIAFLALVDESYSVCVYWALILAYWVFQIIWDLRYEDKPDIKDKQDNEEDVL